MNGLCRFLQQQPPPQSPQLSYLFELNAPAEAPAADTVDRAAAIALGELQAAAGARHDILHGGLGGLIGLAALPHVKALDVAPEAVPGLAAGGVHLGEAA